MPTLAATAEHRRRSAPFFRTGTTIAAANVTAPVAPAPRGSLEHEQDQGFRAARGSDSGSGGKPGWRTNRYEIRPRLEVRGPVRPLLRRDRQRLLQGGRT